MVAREGKSVALTCECSDSIARPRPRLKRGSASKWLGALWFGASLAGLAGCEAEVSSEPRAPIGGAGSATLPHDDVYGFVRLGSQSMEWSLFEQALASAGRGLQLGWFAPLGTLGAPLLDREFVGDGHLTLFFLEPRIHGSNFAFHVAAQREEVLQRLRDAGVFVSEDGTVSGGPHPPSGAGPFAFVSSVAQQALTLLSGDPEEMPEELRKVLWSRYHLVSAASGTLVLPSLDGLRNLRDTLAIACSESMASTSSFSSLDVDRVLGERRTEFQAALMGPLMAMSYSAGGGTKSARYSRRRLMAWIDVAYDLVEGCDHLFALSNDGEFDLYLRVFEGGPTHTLLQAMPPRDPRQLLSSASAGLAAVALSFDPEKLRRYWMRYGHPRFQGRRWSTPSVPLEQWKLFGDRAWVSVGGTLFGEGEGPGLTAGFAGVDPALAPSAVAEGVGAFLDHSQEHGLVSLLPGSSLTRTVVTAAGGVRSHWEISRSPVQFEAGFVPGQWILWFDADEERRAEDLRRLGSEKMGKWSQLPRLPDQCSGTFQLYAGLLTIRAALGVDETGAHLSVGLSGL